MRQPVLIALGTLTVALAACAPTLGPPPPFPPPPPPPPIEPAGPPGAFRLNELTWSAIPGGSSIEGRLLYRTRTAAYTCSGSGVVLMPESGWTIRRMQTLYGSDAAAAVPSAEARRRTPAPPPPEFNQFVRSTTCDAASRFSFSRLPDGAWFIITVARPVAPAQGEEMAIMRRVVTRGGVTSIDL